MVQDAAIRGKKKRKVVSIRVSLKEAAELCDLHYITFWKLANSGMFTTLTNRNKKRGRGVLVFLLRKEVEVYAEEGEDALREFRARRRADLRARRSR